MCSLSFSPSLWRWYSQSAGGVLTALLITEELIEDSVLDTVDNIHGRNKILSNKKEEREELKFVYTSISMGDGWKRQAEKIRGVCFILCLFFYFCLF